ncbi:hypothetical protein HanIR_Chr14g0686421 [Helianthus annuus]|nr:hypothetical protein HanIR_Chr14g0686421 [Helianthus annuus]
MEDVMEKLVDIVIYLNRQIKEAFESALSSACPNMQHKLGPSGLALHYANIVLQIDSIVF